MWFLFGVVTIAGIALLVRQARTPALWAGEDARLESGEEYAFLEPENKGKQTGLLIGVSCPRGFHLTLKPESDVDRFFKRLGVSTEFATRDREFDDRVYIVAEDRRVGAVLYREAEVRAGLLRLFRLDAAGLQLRAVECRDGRLWVVYVGSTTRPAALIAREVVPHLSAFAKALETRAGSTREAPEAPDRFAEKASVLAAIAIAVTLNGFVQWYRSDFFVFPSIIDDRRWLTASAALAFLLLYALVMTSLVWLKRSARTHLVILEVGLAGIFGCFGTALAAVRDLNAALDASAPQVLDVKVVAKHGRGRRSFACRVSVQDWEDEYRWRLVRLPGEVYDQLPDVWMGHGWLRLQVRQGAMGIRYVADAAVIPAPAEASQP